MARLERGQPLAQPRDGNVDRRRAERVASGSEDAALDHATGVSQQCGENLGLAGRKRDFALLEADDAARAIERDAEGVHRAEDGVGRAHRAPEQHTRTRQLYVTEGVLRARAHDLESLRDGAPRVGHALVIMMIFRPEGLFPVRQQLLAYGKAAGDLLRSKPGEKEPVG